MRVRFTSRARTDLVEILNYLDERSPRGARNVKLAIHRTIELIGQAPLGGRLADVHETRVLSAGRYPYTIGANP
jgi:plasmid stabilization system protein ParE